MDRAASEAAIGFPPLYGPTTQDDKTVLSTVWVSQLDLSKPVGERFGRFIATTQTT